MPNTRIGHLERKDLGINSVFASQIQRYQDLGTVCTFGFVWWYYYWRPNAARVIRDLYGVSRFVLVDCTLTDVPRTIAFILYRQHHQAVVVAKHPGLPNPDISKILGEQWRNLSAQTKKKWQALAEVSRI